MTPKRLSLVVVVMVACGCSGKQPSNIRFSKALTGADRVEVFRVDGDPDHWRKDGPHFGKYPLIGRGPDQGADYAARLAAVLSDPATFTDRPDGGIIGCVIQPGIGYRVWRGEESTDILVCFKCGQMKWGPTSDPEADYSEFHQSPRRADLVRLAKEALPDDKEIAAIKEQD